MGWLKKHWKSALLTAGGAALTATGVGGPAGLMMMGSGVGMYGAEEMNEGNIEQAQKQMDFQERMSNTSYQRGTKDMLAAGINPMMAYSQGGASTPTGAAANLENTMESTGNAISNTALAMQDFKAKNASIENTNVNTQVGKTQMLKTAAETDLIRSDLQKRKFNEKAYGALNQITGAAENQWQKMLQNSAKPTPQTNYNDELPYSGQSDWRK